MMSPNAEQKGCDLLIKQRNLIINKISRQHVKFFKNGLLWGEAGQGENAGKEVYYTHRR